MDEQHYIFITGNSRSGTTLMMRIMNNHSLVHAINEPHFFERLWSPSDKDREVNKQEALGIYLNLLIKQREGFFTDIEKFKEKYSEEAKRGIENNVSDKKITRSSIYDLFLLNETVKFGKRIPCEKTPQNVFYIQEILDYFPGAKIVNMIRDPRAVLLSQKKKWKRKSLGADFLTKREIIRLRINYHPLTISRLWNSSISTVQKFKDNPRVFNVKFEELTSDASGQVKKLCDFLDIPFEMDMLQVPHAGSSSQHDDKEAIGIRKGRADSWKQKGLTNTEVFICQNICGKYMRQFDYPKTNIKPSILELIGQYLAFPFKLFLAFVVNLGRMRSMADTLRRRLQS